MSIPVVGTSAIAGATHRGMGFDFGTTTQRWQNAAVSNYLARPSAMQTDMPTASTLLGHAVHHFFFFFFFFFLLLLFLFLLLLLLVL